MEAEEGVGWLTGIGPMTKRKGMGLLSRPNWLVVVEGLDRGVTPVRPWADTPPFALKHLLLEPARTAKLRSLVQHELLPFAVLKVVQDDSPKHWQNRLTAAPGRIQQQQANSAQMKLSLKAAQMEASLIQPKRKLGPRCLYLPGPHPNASVALLRTFQGPAGG